MKNHSSEVGSKSEIPIPTELEGKNLGNHAQQGKGGEVEGVVATPGQSKSKKLDHVDKYAKHLHSYIREYISAADKKASFVFAIGAALLVYLYERNFAVSWVKSVNAWAINDVVIFLAIAGLTISCLLSILVVVPALKGSKRGLVFWDSIAEFDNSSEFSEELFKLGDSQLTGEIIRHSYELARVCKHKYVLLNWSLRIGAVGAICTLLVLVKG
jgi:hypothetical protein